jgi:hypothetical protein
MDIDEGDNMRRQRRMKIVLCKDNAHRWRYQYMIKLNRPRNFCMVFDST